MCRFIRTSHTYEKSPVLIGTKQGDKKKNLKKFKKIFAKNTQNRKVMKTRLRGSILAEL
tara:strand:- start:1206 stop:1382 length:177 start_codon:yes stop_codon:yes gene_type:complete